MVITIKVFKIQIALNTLARQIIINDTLGHNLSPKPITPMHQKGISKLE